MIRQMSLMLSVRGSIPGGKVMLEKARQVISDEVKAEVVRLTHEGYSKASIARHFNIHVNSVYRFVHASNLVEVGHVE
ncbi:hypothetical protein swp_3230 [Shewanella piezotolerans WP3]|uniref:Resolvase HTH domain-containing protein n=2 Tax=Shewanella TaxID=22 RepID=B8CRC8_SHEPW|nr:hypothetical protein swp_3230 [Shewanella piezotolerans WP3]